MKNSTVPLRRVKFSGTPDVFALDFDGVLCDSASEGAVTAWRSGGKIWPEWRGPEPPEDCRVRFVQLRPLVETGYQMPLLMRLIHDHINDAEILSGFGPLCDGLMKSHGLTRPQLVDLFGQARDEWIAQDSADWLSRHRFYPGVLARFRNALDLHPVFILTTKGERFVRELLDAAGAIMPGERILGFERKISKARMLEQVMAEPSLQGARIHFVEDRVETLFAVAGNPHLEGVRLYLADWGYNTPAQREQARRHPRISVSGLDRFLHINSPQTLLDT
jgi:phosphoglycolate phosphatase-like HAD superfamily hydrolase